MISETVALLKLTVSIRSWLVLNVEAVTCRIWKTAHSLKPGAHCAILPSETNVANPKKIPLILN